MADLQLQEIWSEIEKSWGDLLELFRQTLPINDHVILGSDCTFDLCGRPLIESVLDLYIKRDSELFRYIDFAVAAAGNAAAGNAAAGNAAAGNAAGGTDFHIKVGNMLNLRSATS